MGETFDFEGGLGTKKRGDLGKPEGEFDPQEHTQFIGEVKNVLRREPQTKFDTIVAQGFEPDEICPNAGGAWVRAPTIRIPPPREDETGVEGAFVEEQGVFLGGEGAKAKAENFLVPILDG